MKNELKLILTRLGLLKAAVRVRDYVRSVKFIKSNLHYYLIGADDGVPIPALRLIVLVTGQPDIDLFLKTGRLAAVSIRDTLLKQGLRLENFHSILDFGCGCGRVTRYWKGLPNTKICGVDYNAALVRWCSVNFKFGRFQNNSIDPPLTYDEASFDFIYALSVFTHLTQELQFAWMKELLRVLQPGGYLLITTHGEYYLSHLNETERISFLSGDLIIKNDGAVGSNLLGAYHPREYVLKQLSNGLELLDFIPEGAKGNPFQDLYLFKKIP